jgi:thiamine pyrophosphokinase
MDLPPPILKDIQSSDLIIAADGGTHHCERWGIMPNVIVGDFDSLVSKEVITFQQAGVEIIQYPAHKDETDLELALQLSLKGEVTDVYILGALGARWDMTIANVLLAANPMFSQVKIRLLDGLQELIILRGEGRIDIDGHPGDVISLIPLGGDAYGITTHGLEYPLNDETLNFGSPRGVSNTFSHDQAQVFIRKGILLLCSINREIN